MPGGWGAQNIIWGGGGDFFGEIATNRPLTELPGVDLEPGVHTSPPRFKIFTKQAANAGPERDLQGFRPLFATATLVQADPAATFEEVLQTANMRLYTIKQIYYGLKAPLHLKLLSDAVGHRSGSIYVLVYR